MSYWFSKQMDFQKKIFTLKIIKTVVYAEGEIGTIFKVLNAIENVTKQLPETTTTMSFTWINIAWIYLKMLKMNLVSGLVYLSWELDASFHNHIQSLND